MPYAQISQDIFVFNLLKKQPGYFLDLGCGDGRGLPNGNNSLFLEENKWNGIGIDIDSGFIDTYNKTRNTLGICADLSLLSIQDILDNPAIANSGDKINQVKNILDTIGNRK
jgi:SAM-dependent methyltransferase